MTRVACLVVTLITLIHAWRIGAGARFQVAAINVPNYGIPGWERRAVARPCLTMHAVVDFDVVAAQLLHYRDMRHVGNAVNAGVAAIVLEQTASSVLELVEPACR